MGLACPGSELTRLWTPQFQQGSPGKTGPRGGVVSASNLPSRHHPPLPAPPTPRHQGIISRIASGWGGAGVTGRCSPCSHAMRGHRDLTVSQSAGRPGGGWPPRRKRREGEKAARGGGEQRAGLGTPPPRDSTFLCLQGESGEPGPKGQVSPAAVTPPSPAPAAPRPPLVASAPLGTRTATPRLPCTPPHPSPTPA